MIQMLRRFRIFAGMGAAALVLAACGGGSDDESSTGDTGAASGDRPSWCGDQEIVLGMTDGFGGNSWRLVTTASGRDEAAKCPSVTEFLYADGQGNTQKAIADIQSMVAQGVNALVVFPDAGEAMLPALRSAYEADVVTVPYRVFPGGEDGKDYTAYIGLDSQNDGRNWANWITEVLPDGGNILFLSGPAGNSQGEGEAEGLHEVLDPLGKYTFIGEQPFEVTNWDPAETQKVLTAAIAKYQQIDVIVSDFGPSLVGALPAFTDGRKVHPADRHVRRQRPGLLLAGQQGRQPRLQAVHHRHRKRPCPHRDAVRHRTGHRRRGAGLEGAPARDLRELRQRRPQRGAVREGSARGHLPVRRVAA